MSTCLERIKMVRVTTTTTPARMTETMMTMKEATRKMKGRRRDGEVDPRSEIRSRMVMASELEVARQSC
jgi:hypothetical protein